jgi:hypothetical protein
MARRACAPPRSAALGVLVAAASPGGSAAPAADGTASDIRPAVNACVAVRAGAFRGSPWRRARRCSCRTAPSDTWSCCCTSGSRRGLASRGTPHEDVPRSLEVAAEEVAAVSAAREAALARANLTLSPHAVRAEEGAGLSASRHCGSRARLGMSCPCSVVLVLVLVLARVRVRV